MEVFINSIFLISYKEEMEYNQLEWYSTPNLNQFKDSFLLMSNLQDQTQVKTWMIDTRKLGMINITEQNWLVDIIMPKVIEKGLNRIAFVTGGNKLIKVCVNKIVEQLENNAVEVAFFYDIKDANDWIEIERESILTNQQ